jgi:uncharacterized protein
MPLSPELTLALTDEETDELDQFLMSDAVSDEAMDLDCLDGYLTAIAIGPVTLMPSSWLSGIWGNSEDDAPVFETAEQAQRIIGLIMRQMNGIIASLEDDADAFEPIFGRVLDKETDREHFDGEMWADGFMRGMALCADEWLPLFDSRLGQEMLSPIYLLTGEKLTEEMVALVDTPAKKEGISLLIPASVAGMYRYWRIKRVAGLARPAASKPLRAEPKVGRNDPCPCGSGKKFKKCCGAAA